MCAHCARIEPDHDGIIGAPVTVPSFDPEQLLLSLDYPSGLWYTLRPDTVICDHGKPDGATLCPLCQERLWRALADIPRLTADLDIHFTKQNVFLERGLPQPSKDEDAEVIDESPLPYVEAASKALRDIRDLLGERPAKQSVDLLHDWPDTLRRPDLAEFTSRLTRATTKAFRVIDMDPYLTHYGICPTCKGDIRQERVPEGGKVEHSCGYSAEVAEHRAVQLDLAGDTPLTLTRVVQVLNDAGEPVKRQDIENLIYRHGLPREQIPVWSNGRLERVWHYRLGDVRDGLKKKRRAVA